MAKVIDTTISQASTDSGVERQQARSRPAIWSWLALGAVILISLFMNFFQLGQNGFGNLYYAAGVKSMGDSLHNFFFVSFDPGGFVTIDKPPLGFWLQVISTKIFGFTPFSVFFPQALAGVLSVLLLYWLVRRRFGTTAGLLAAFALAISPISVLTNRNNTIDSTLILVLLLGAWAVLRAAETGKLRWLLLCAVCIGLGFNIKMLQAYLVVPAYGLLYLLAAPRSIWKRLLHLGLALLLMASISLSWAAAVDLTPSSSRPYVGSSQDNSEISLAFGYNGVQRLLGSFGMGGGNRQTPPINSSSTTQSSSTTAQNTNSSTELPPMGDGGPQGGSNNGGPFNTGTAGVLRLFNEPLAGQIAWLLPMALLGIVALAWQRRLNFREDREQQSLILWGGWLLTTAVFFSMAGFFHQYYLSTMAPAICALFGIGAVIMWRDYRHAGWRGWLLPVALVLTALEQLHIITSNTAWGTWMIPLIAIPCALAAIVLIVARLVPLLKANTRLQVSLVSLSLMALLLTSAVWSATPVLQNSASSLPVAGPSQQFGGFGGGGNDHSSTNTNLISYLEANKGNAKYLVATASSNEADSIILATNQSVMALGGFSGSDPILTTDQLATLVANGTVRYFLINGSGGGPGGGQSELTTWITQNCTVVPSSEWQSSTSNSGNSGGVGGFGGASQLYVCNTAS
ncbi:putative mannosyltransferase YycA [Reticulibacter mediterranei]|uniref:Putative mannosyltransferase YycA n=1 Tax=Reticulibacter mediterranei TaxID=2778369 RepID=A0A8J3IQV3_9CHLR|nr:glycosyltransferase family 39 protein [Reticulibacter mediterranei]GHO99086.1 putative mannosyltransferase YycA [Reticulibacter mediterranei]